MSAPATDTNLQQAVPFFRVEDMAASLRFYVDGLGFSMSKSWIDEGTVRWCWLERDGVGLMLQDLRTETGHHRLEGKPGIGVSIMIICSDALVIYHEAVERGLHPDRPFVGNGMWVVGFDDPDGYRVEFESYTDVPEGTVYEA